MSTLSPNTAARLVDHTLLKADAKIKDLEQLCREACEYHFYGVCVNSSHIPLVAKLLAGSQTIPLSVVGFPLGAASTAAKIYETKWAIEQGAHEIDTVLAIGAYLSGQERYVREDIKEVVEAAGDVPVKIILETAYLLPDQIIELTRWSADAGVRYVKTSTGFAARGASVEDVKLMTATLKTAGCYPQIGVKASGGIKNADHFRAMVDAGATRIGCSASVTIMHELAGEKPRGETNGY